MKKFFTLIAAVALAASVNAQATFDAVSDGELPAGQVLKPFLFTNVDGMTSGADTWKVILIKDRWYACRNGLGK